MDKTWIYFFCKLVELFDSNIIKKKTRRRRRIRFWFENWVKRDSGRTYSRARYTQEVIGFRFNSFHSVTYILYEKNKSLKKIEWNRTEKTHWESLSAFVYAVDLADCRFFYDNLIGFIVYVMFFIYPLTLVKKSIFYGAVFYLFLFSRIRIIEFFSSFFLYFIWFVRDHAFHSKVHTQEFVDFQYWAYFMRYYHNIHKRLKLEESISYQSTRMRSQQQQSQQH